MINLWVRNMQGGIYHSIGTDTQYFWKQPKANVPEDMDQYVADLDNDTDVTESSNDNEGNFIFSDPLTKRDKRIMELNETINK